MTRRLLARMAGAAALLAGAVALLFLLLESGVAGDPARAEAGPRAGAAELAAARARLGMVKDFHAAALRLELDGPPRRLSLLAAGGALVLREGADLERARVPLAGLPLTVAADRLAGAAATLAPPARLRVTVIPELAQRPAQGLLAALADARVDLEPGAPATLPWAESVPLPRRLGARVWAVARLDFGTDRNGRPILPEIAARGARSLAYALPAFLLTTVLALTLAMACAARRGWLDRALTMLAGIVMAASSLALIPLIRRLLTAEWELLPLRPWSAPYLPLLALPALTWILIAVWPELRLYRALALEESARPWLRAARARGLSERRLRWAHLAPNLAAPVLAHAAVTLPYLLLGSLALERAYDVPGLGEYVADALAHHDARALEAATLTAAAAFLLAHALTATLAAILDPRQRAPAPEAA